MIVRADARYIPLRNECVQCVVTSPPYFGLRNYGHANQIGLESSPIEYVNALVTVFTEVRRVLANDGVLWLNLGDSYTGSWGARGRGEGTNAPRQDLVDKYGTTTPQRAVDGCKAKDMIGIPWMVVFALRSDGWYLRSDIIWSKPNPMPESITDRPTKSHEYLFLFAKSPRYYYDAKAIAEPVSDAMLLEVEQGYDGLGLKDYEAASVQNPSSVKARIIANARRKQDAYGPRPTRNKRTVWTIPTQPYQGAHFATMPEKLIEPCILAGSRMRDIVFDPFLGSGTVGKVAEEHGRRWVGTDLAYQDLSSKRTAQRSLLSYRPEAFK